MSPTSGRLAVTAVLAVNDDVPEVVLHEALEPLAQALTQFDASATLTLDPPRFEIDLELQLKKHLTLPTGEVRASATHLTAASLQAAMQVVVDQVVPRAEEVLGAKGTLALQSLTLQTEAARDQYLADLARERDFVGLTDIAAMLGTEHRQRALTVSKTPGFPAPIYEVSGKRVWQRSAVADWIHIQQSKKASRRPGQPVGNTPGQAQREALAEALATAVREGRIQRDSPAAAAAGRPHLLYRQALADAIHALGGPAPVARMLGVADTTPRRWLVRATGLDAAGNEEPDAEHDSAESAEVARQRRHEVPASS